MAERILIVEDEEVMRDLLSSILSSAGYECRTAGGGLEALAVLDSGEEFALVVSTLIMPRMDGIALLERIKGRSLNLPVVFETGVHDMSVFSMALQNGAYDCIFRPWEPEQLLAAARRGLEFHRLNMEIDRLLKERSEYQSRLEALVVTRTDELRKTIAGLERSYDITLEALGDAIDLKDAENEGHSKRVTAFTIAISRAMDVSQDDIRAIARAAFLHDIGNIALPDRILRKPGTLDAGEIAIMREHCLLGYKLMSRIAFLKDAAEIVYSHHEKWDGTGYPRGLQGEDIPLGARIFSIADALDAITSERPYRRAQSLTAARKEIQRWSGRQFDPAIVRVFLAMPDEIWQSLAAEILRKR